MPAEAVVDAVATVFQDVYLYDESIRFNVTLGARNAPTPSSAGLEDIISIMKSSGSLASRIDKDATTHLLAPFTSLTQQ